MVSSWERHTRGAKYCRTKANLRVRWRRLLLCLFLCSQVPAFAQDMQDPETPAPAQNEPAPFPVAEAKTAPVKGEADAKGDGAQKKEAAAKPLNCSKGFLSLRTPPPACKARKQVEYALLPAVFSTKETSFGAAVYGEVSFYSDKKPKTGVSRTGLALTYTVRKQFIARMPLVVAFQNNDFLIDGAADFRIYPNRYYGLGNQSDWDYQVYREDVLNFNYEFRRRVWGPLYMGLTWDLRYVFEVVEGDAFDEHGKELPSDQPGQMEVDRPAGSDPYLNQAVGLQAVYDTRDNFAYPLKGGYHRASLRFFDMIFGSAYTYALFTVDLRQYIRLSTRQVLVFQLLSEVRDGEAPFSMQAELGGPSLLRGYFKGRYRAENMALIQSEYRYPIYKRLSGVAFGSVGEVYGKGQPFRADLLRWTLGAGLRFRFGDQTYMRMDVGGNHETFALIFNGGQAF